MSEATSSERASARLSSSTARRETTMLPRERSILRIWNGCGDAEQRRDIAHRADIDLAAGQERDGAGEIDGEAAFDAAEDHAVDALIRLEALLQQGPRFLAARLLARELRFAVLVFHPLEIDLDGVAGLDLRLPARRGKFAQRDAAFRFQADIDQHRIVFDGEHPAFDDGSFNPLAVPSDSSSSAAKLSLLDAVCVATAIRSPEFPFDSSERSPG